MTNASVMADIPFDRRLSVKSTIHLAATILFGGMALAAIGFAQTTGETETKFVTFGEVSNIDIKGKSITIKDGSSYNITSPSEAAPGGRGGGGGRGAGIPGIAGGGRRGGGSVPGVSLRNASNGTASKDYKIVVSSKTIFKEDATEIQFTDLKVGDQIQVVSPKGGSKLEASEIFRSPKP